MASVHPLVGVTVMSGMVTVPSGVALDVPGGAVGTPHPTKSKETNARAQRLWRRNKPPLDAISVQRCSALRRIAIGAGEITRVRESHGNLSRSGGPTGCWNADFIEQDVETINPVEQVNTIGAGAALELRPRYKQLFSRSAHRYTFLLTGRASSTWRAAIDLWQSLSVVSEPVCKAR